MRAVVKKAFQGVQDGEIHPRAFSEGDVVSGDLAAVAVAEGWAEGLEGEASGEGDQDDQAGDIDLDALSKKDLEALAAERGVDLSHARSKAEIIAALEAAQD